jgi:hypothetical protein
VALLWHAAVLRGVPKPTGTVSDAEKVLNAGEEVLFERETEFMAACPERMPRKG